MAKKMTQKRITAVIVRPCNWKSFDDMAEKIVLPKDGKAVTSWDNQDDAWLNVSAELEKVINNIRNTSPRPDFPPDTIDSDDDCPYCGLQSFKEKDADYFFGRNNFIHNQLIPAIENKSLPFILLFGATGVGKSSVVFAGLIPRLKRENWKCVNFEPGNDPFYSLAQTLISLNNRGYWGNHDKEASKLAEALKEKQDLSSYLVSIERNLSQDNLKLLIIIDKFEEIYRESPYENNANSQSDQVNQGFKFLRCLLSGIKWLKEKSHSNRIVFLAITTSEGHSKTTDFPDYAELSDPSANIQLTGLKPEEMRHVIEEPANKKGVQFEEGLVDTIIHDAGQEPGMLPLLEVALRQLWGHRTSGLITKDAYRTIGGMRALVTYADQCMAGLKNKIYHEIAKDIFLQIIDAREDLISTKDISPKEIIMDDLTAKEKDPTIKENTKLVVNFLVKKRLLVRESQDSKQVLKIPHDTLIKQWPQIDDWLNQDARNRYFINDLGKRAENWQKSGQKEIELDSGLMLELTEKFLNENPDDFRLNDLMKEFHGKGIIKKRSDEEKRKNDEKRRMDDEAKRRSDKRRNIFIFSSLLLSTFALAIGSVVKNRIDNKNNQLAFQRSEVRRQVAEIKKKEAEIKKQDEELKHLGTQERLVLAVKGKYLSSGKKTHFVPSKPEERIDLKKINGNRAFSAKQYDKAKSLFNAARTNTRDDPEVLIYSNNAEAFLSGNYLTIVASVPIKYSNDIAKEMLRGIAHAQDEINRKGGIKGKLLHVVIADDNNDPADVDVIANYLISNKEVLAVVGSNASEATKQAANIYQGEMVMISPTSFAINFNEIKKPENGKNYIFLAVNDYEVVMPKLVKHIKDTVTPPKLFVCDDSGAFDQNVFREFFTKNGLSLVQVKNEATKEEILCDLINKEDSYEKIVEKAIQLGINSLFIAPHVSRISDGINLARHARAINPELILFGSPTLYNAITLIDGGVTTGLVIPAHWHPDVSQKHPFYREAIELWGKQNINGITWRTAASYDAVYVISTALEKIDINDGFSRENLQLKLAKEGFEYEGALGEIRFEQNGARQESDSFLIKVEPCHENCPEGYEYSFYLTN